jgi:hypothetical protein
MGLRRYEERERERERTHECTSAMYNEAAFIAHTKLMKAMGDDGSSAASSGSEGD